MWVRAMVWCGWIVASLIFAEPSLRAQQPAAADGQTTGNVRGPATPQKQGAAKPETRANAHDNEPEPESHQGFSGLEKDFLLDQKHIWTSPARIRSADTEWLVPLAGISAGFFVTDRTVTQSLARDPKTVSHYNTLSNAGIGALVGGAAGLWLLSYPSHNEHWRETGLLAGEAALNSLIPVEVFKYSLRRERPLEGDGGGHFFQGGTSFPSEHSAAAWAVAGVVAHEYPGPLPKLVAYGLASAVSYWRVQGSQHFPSDVFMGTILGSLIAQQVYSRHHDPELGGGEWRSIGDLFRESRWAPENRGSPYVALDSWIYPALDRLAAFGLVDSAFAGDRPWTRRECARLVSEADEHLAEVDGEDRIAQDLISELDREFRPEREGTDSSAFRVESLYSRVGYISGTPLRDGYHFGQTQINDFGRPYGQGWNSATGFSAYATQGRWVTYFRGEWQGSASLPALPLTARETIQQVDHLPELPLDVGQPSVNRFEVLDAYVGLMFSNWQLSFGRQSLWWGPGDGGPLIFSDNAAPLNIFRVNRVTPLKLPSILGWLGPMRLEFFLGQLSGQQFINVNGPTGSGTGSFFHTLHPQPMIHGERFTFKPTRNFEFGFSRTVLFAGEGVPFTLRSFGKSLFSFSRTNSLGNMADPGDRRSGMDWSYRLPRLRDWVTFYGDAFADDQISPIAYWDRSAIRAGLFFSHLPGLPKLDLRAEGVYTDLPAGGALSHGFFYSNLRYLNGYTSQGQLLASWIGRQGQGAQGWANYWFSARSRIQFNYRHQKVSQEFIPGGGTLTEVGMRSDYWLRSNFGLSTWVQYERWQFPVIQPNSAGNVTAAVEVQFQPQKLFHHPSDSAAVNMAPSRGRP
jgi:membrane-associated phospholipid phosphatase